MDALLLLTGDHNRVRGLFNLFKASHEAQDLQRGQHLAEKIMRELTVHTEIEETIFYPTCGDAADTKLQDLVVEGYEEHRVVKDLINEVNSADLVVMVAAAGESAQAASIIGEACSAKRVMTTALVLGGSTVSDAWY